MSVFLLVLIIIALALAAWTVLIYNGLVQLKHNTAKAWSNIDVLLRQRHEELPKLVETCRQYQQFETATLTRVTEARASVAAAPASAGAGRRSTAARGRRAWSESRSSPRPGRSAGLPRRRWR